MDDVSRRLFILSGLGIVAAGCTGGRRDPKIFRPGSPSGRLNGRPTGVIAPGNVNPTPGVITPPAASGPTIIKRSAWADYAAIPARMDRMNGINAMTVHHEGMPRPTLCTNKWDVIRELRLVRGSHVSRMTAGDIGYHYIVDRAGRIWEGRSLVYQGAHVKDNNYHNIGVMVMGNFEIQYPTSAQEASLDKLLRHLMSKHRIQAPNLHTHRELRATACPGRHLQPKVEAFRRTV